jgi:predicted AAA+ superfamily ATPase
MAIATAVVTDLSTAAAMAGVSRKTARAYGELLQAVHALSLLPAWHSNRLKRVTRRPKQHLVEPALLGPAARVDTETILADARLLGRLLESFVAAQLRAELEWSATRARMHHLRLEKGEHEIDLVLEGGGRVVAVEVKAAAHVGARDARHLAWLRDRLGERFRLGVLLHCGKLGQSLGDRLIAAPIETLWRAT